MVLKLLIQKTAWREAISLFYFIIVFFKVSLFDADIALHILS